MPALPPPRPSCASSACGYGHPDALLLIEEVQAEYVRGYGGRDETPLDPAMFDPPGGSFFVGYLVTTARPAGRHRRLAAALRRRGPRLAAYRRGQADVRRRLGSRRRPRPRRCSPTWRHRGRGRRRGDDPGDRDRSPRRSALYESSGYAPIPGFGYYKDSADSCYGSVRHGGPSAAAS